MKYIINLILSLFQPAQRPVITLGKGFHNFRALRQVLAETKSDAIRARNNNYRRSVRRILDQQHN
jgi:hypothetical protein